MAKDIFFVSVGCLHLGYTAVKIYQAFNGDLPSFSSVSGYIRNTFQAKQTEMPQSAEPDSKMKTSDDISLDDCEPSIAEFVPESLNANNSENNLSNDSTPGISRPPLSRRAQAIQTTMTMKSKRWLQEQTKKDGDSLVFRSAANYRYAKRFGLNAKLAPPQKKRY
ncbi:hypothetical protein AVEN_1793-1 [Araneus ventricosus]|uniref:Uncharacterized protein n=1 Tax=Araneus ventricosus TaxID=182803 RepID=A0A4Y2JZJ6_ARAVE|nr:hypothetical protein AVEN_1793-1 [Araneus ventricosus]